MRRFRMTIVLAFATFLSISICSAQQTATTSVPNLVRYSGTLKDAQGAALSSSTAVGVTFSIYKQQDGGAAVWMETQNVTPDASGQYSVILGSTTATGLPDDLFLQQEQRWLGVQVQGQDEQARVLLVSVPYAFKAHEAETLGGLPASAFVKAPSAGGAIGTYGYGTAVNALGTAGKAGGTSAPGGIKTVSDCLSPKLGALTLWSKQIQINPPIWELCNSNLFQVLTGPFKGNIGIGNTNPSKSLDVSGEINTRKWYDIASPELAFAGVGFQFPGILPNNRDTFVGVGAGTTNPLNPLAPPTPASETDNTFMGYYAGSKTTGNYNTFMGALAGSNNNTAVGNTFVGASAGSANQAAGSNTFIGAFSGSSNLTGAGNTFVGGDSGGVATGSGNTFVGFNSGFFDTADNNSFYGFRSGDNNITGNHNTFLGYYTGESNVTGNQNTFVGSNAGAANVVGNNNTFTGQNAGKANTADSNSFFGSNAGAANNTGANNTFLGRDAGMTNATGGGNTSVGFQAGMLADGCCSTFVGSGAGVSTTVGGNQFFGYRAGGSTTTGIANVFTGYFTGQQNTVGNYNAFYGVNTGLTNTMGSSNAFFGVGAGSSSNQTGNFNIYIGRDAGNGAGAGNSNNIEIGNAGQGTDNGAIRIGVQGTQSMQTFVAGIYEQQSLTNTRSVVVDVNGHLGTGTGGGGIGPCALGQNYLTKWTNGTPSTTVDCARIWENPAGANQYFVGIGPTFQSGTPNPTRQLQVDGDIDEADIGHTTGHYQIAGNTVLSIDPTVLSDNLFAGVGACSSVINAGNTCVGSHAGGDPSNTGKSNTLVGFNAGFKNTNGQDNTFVGRSAGVNNKGGTGNIFIGASAGSNQGAGGLAGGSADIYIGNPGLAGADETGVIRLGVPSSQTDTYIAGILNSTINATNYPVCIDASHKLASQAAACNPGSSRRFKDQILDMGNRTSRLFELRPVTFFYKPQYDDGTHSLQYGLIAEEVDKIYPEMVVYDKDGQPSGVKYQLLAPMLLNELQKQHTIVAAQQDVIKTQQQQITDLQQRLSRLEMLVDSAVRATQQQPAAPMRSSGLR